MFQGTISITSLGFKSLRNRWSSVLILVFCLVSVELIFIGLLSMIHGFQSTMDNSGSDHVALIIRKGSLSEVNSVIAVSDIPNMLTSRSIAKEGQEAIAGGEFFIVVELPTKENGNLVNVPLRGVERKFFSLRPNLKLLEGRLFTPGTNEIVVGKGAARQYGGLAIGQTVRFESFDWKVTGIFDDGSSVFESEIWCDLHVMQSAFKHKDTVQTLRVKLNSIDDFSAFKSELEGDQRYEVEVIRESEYFEKQSSALVDVIKKVGYPISFLMALGAMFAVLNTLYSSISNRAEEFATLRALGFSKSCIYFAIVIESAIVTLFAGAVGIFIGEMMLDGMVYSTMNGASFSQVVFQFNVSGEILVQSVLMAFVIGIVASLIPALQASRMSVARALRSV